MKSSKVFQKFTIKDCEAYLQSHFLDSHSAKVKIRMKEPKGGSWYLSCRIFHAKKMEGVSHEIFIFMLGMTRNEATKSCTSISTIVVDTIQNVAQRLKDVALLKIAKDLDISIYFTKSCNSLERETLH